MPPTMVQCSAVTFTRFDTLTNNRLLEEREPRSAFLARVWAALEPITLKASHKCWQAFAQLAVTFRYRPKMLAKPRADLSRR